MLRLSLCLPLLAGLILCASMTPSLQAAAPPTPPALAIDGLGKGTAPLDGPWQFHIGDDMTWARSQTPDAAGTNGWEQLTANKTWGAQGHPAYAGYAWYRKHLHLTPAPGVSTDLYLLIPGLDDVDEIYWNGQLVGGDGRMPPKPLYYYQRTWQIAHLGRAGDGVLAVRVWKAPLESFDSAQVGGFRATPSLGSLDAVTSMKAAHDYTWLRSRQYYFALRALYALVMLLSLIGWLRDRSRHVLLAMTCFSGSPFVAMFLVGLELPISHSAAIGWLQPFLSLQDVGLWFLLLYLLQLEGNRALMRSTKILTVISLAATALDGSLEWIWNAPGFSTAALQAGDAILTAIFTVTQMFPWVLLAFGLRKRLDSSRWIVAISALLTESLFFVRIAAEQGSRFTHWTLGATIARPMFFFNGNAFTPQVITDSILILAIIYAVARYVRDSVQRQSALEQEYKSARELQQVLIPEDLPALPGFAFTSAYKPAQEVGGDFFQVIPLDGDAAGSTLILLGDVSGKGLRAAMTVSLIVGAVRTVAKFVHSPAAILSELNTRLDGRMQGGFVTCLALLLRPDGQCVMASAGHPAPYLNDRAIELPGALPLGVLATATYEEEALELREGDHFALYTDGLLEARRTTGEIFSFERLDTLFATRPDAARATEAAVDFGQDDDITVLTLTRLVRGEKSTSQLIAPALAG